jgi:hypothetical protein
MTNVSRPIKQKLNKPKKPRPTGAAKWIVAAVCLVLLATGLTIVALNMLAKAAVNTASGMAVSGVELVSKFSSAVLEGLEMALLEGSDEDRVAVLNELVKIDFSTNPEGLPKFLVGAIESNLENGNEEVREAAKRVLDSMNAKATIAGDEFLSTASDQ